MLLRCASLSLSQMRRSDCEGEAGDEAFSSAWASEIRLRALSCCCSQLACRGPSLRSRSRHAHGPSISEASWAQFLQTSSQHRPANKTPLKKEKKIQSETAREPPPPNTSGRKANASFSISKLRDTLIEFPSMHACLSRLLGGPWQSAGTNADNYPVQSGGSRHDGHAPSRVPARHCICLCLRPPSVYINRDRTAERTTERFFGQKRQRPFRGHRRQNRRSSSRTRNSKPLRGRF